MTKRVEYIAEERGPTPETAAKLTPDWFKKLSDDGKVSPEEYDIGLEIREAYRWVTKPVDWHLGDLLDLGGQSNESEPPQVLRYYAWCRHMNLRGAPIRKVLDFCVEGATCFSSEFSRACRVYVEANGWHWRW